MTNQLPAYLQNRQSKALARTLQENLGSGQPPYLSIEGGRFTLIDAVGNALPVATFDPQMGQYIDMNIIDVNNTISKIYFDPENPYDPKQADRAPPLCWSDNGVGPSRNAGSPQAPTCAACPNNTWGSATSKVSGKGIKACSDIQKIAFTTGTNKTVFLLRVPPNSLAEMRAYVGRFVGEAADISDVVTRVSFKQGIIGTLQFQAAAYIDEPTMALRESILASKASDAIVGRLDSVHPAVALPAPGVEQRHTVVVEQGGGAGPANGAQGGGSASYAPYNPPVTAFQTTVSPATAPTDPASAQVPSAPPTRRRGRPPAVPAQQASTPQATPIQAPFPTGAPAAGPGNNFGIQPGVPPNQEIAATLDTLFGPRQ